MRSESTIYQIVVEMGVSIPHEFICPMTQDVMSVPLMMKSGFNFEESVIFEWIRKGSGTCPLTRRSLKPSDLVPNAALQEKI
jgi:U-box domain